MVSPVSERKCVPCLRQLDAILTSLRLARATISERDKFRAHAHLEHAEYNRREMENLECLPKDTLSYLESQLKVASEAVDRKDWSEAEWRVDTAFSLTLEPGLLHIISKYCEEECR